ncbi:MAG: tetratricopeptide repeat protein [Myxococcales bacterium]|nr:tetratricopeptide repeat protein [Myxococcales bacterium]
MKDILPALQLVCLALIAAGVAPVALDALDARADRKAREARAAVFGAIAEAASTASDHDLAAQAFADAANLDPDNEGWRKGLLDAQVERILRDSGHITGANALSLQVALTRALSDGDPSARHELAFGRVLHFRGQLEKARARYKAALDKDPQSAQAHLLLGDLQFKQGEYGAAVTTLRRAVELDAELPLVHFALGQALLGQKNAQEAVVELEKAVKAMPQHAASHGALGKAALELKRFDTARTHLESALRLDRAGLASLYRDLGDAWEGLENLPRAEQAYTQAWQQAQDLVGLRRLARVRMQQRNWQGTIDAYNLVLSVVPDDPEAHCQTGMAADKANAGRVAVVAYQRCIAVAEKDPDFKELVATARNRQQILAERMTAQAREAGKDAPKAPPKGGKGP